MRRNFHILCRVLKNSVFLIRVPLNEYIIQSAYFFYRCSNSIRDPKYRNIAAEGKEKKLKVQKIRYKLHVDVEDRKHKYLRAIIEVHTMK